MNIYDIAKETGYSIATVSRAINASGYVSEKAKNKIMEVIDRHGYVVNPFAKGMATSSMSLAGVLSTDSRDQFQAECIYHLQSELKNLGFTALLSCTGTKLTHKQDAIRLLLSRNVDCIFLIGSQFVEQSERDNLYLKQAAKKVPIILLNGHMSHPNIYSLRCDDRKGLEELTSHILSTGAKHPILLTRRNTYSTQRKTEGFISACQNYQISGKDKIFQVSSSTDLFYSLEQILNSIQFDSLLCCDDEMAVACLKYCLKNHLKVPEEVQITGYNNSSLSRLSPHEISTYDNRIEYLCRTAASCMQTILTDTNYPSESTYLGKAIFKDTTK